MDFFSGAFGRHPVISAISPRTSSAVARNSGLLLPLLGTEGAGAACWHQADTPANHCKNRKADKRRKNPLLHFVRIKSQNSRLPPARWATEVCHYFLGNEHNPAPWHDPIRRLF